MENKKELMEKLDKITSDIIDLQLQCAGLQMTLTALSRRLNILIKNG